MHSLAVVMGRAELAIAFVIAATTSILVFVAWEVSSPGRSSRLSNPPHRNVWDAVFDIVAAGSRKAPPGIPTLEMGLRFERDLPLAEVVQRPTHQHPCIPMPPMGLCGGNPPDAARLAVGQDAEGSPDLVSARLADPQVLGAGGQIQSVELRVGALLLNDEHVDAQPQQAVQLASGQRLRRGNRDQRRLRTG